RGHPRPTGLARRRVRRPPRAGAGPERGPVRAAPHTIRRSGGRRCCYGDTFCRQNDGGGRRRRTAARGGGRAAGGGGGAPPPAGVSVQESAAGGLLAEGRRPLTVGLVLTI